MSMTRGKTVAVYSGSGGTGKTVVATSLAVAYQQQESARVLVVDAAFPLPGDTVVACGIERAKALAEMAPILGKLTPEVFSTYLVTAPSGVSVMPLVNDVLQSRLVTPQLLNLMFDLATAAFDLVVLDMSAGVSPLTGDLFERCDEVCVVSDTTTAGVIRARHCVDYLRSLQISTESLLYCVNRMPERAALTPEKLERLVGLGVTVMLPEDVEAVQGAMARGIPVSVAYPRHAIARAIDRLGREVATRGLRARSSRPGFVGPSVQDLADEDVRALKLKIHRRLVEEIDLRKADLSYLRDPVKLQEVRTRAEAKVLALLDEEGRHVQSRDVRRTIVKDVLDEALGLGPLEDLLAEAAVTEIMVNRHDQIYVERAGRLQMTNVRFLNVEQLRGIIERIVAPLGRRIDEKVPMVDARLRDGSRVNAIIPPLALKGPALTIRKFSRKLLGVDDLVRFGAFTPQMATFLGAAVQGRMNIVISGGTGSGKTTLLNVLASFIPNDERILTIEDAAELQLPQDHVVTLEARPANIEGEGAITIRDLVRNALRMRPDRIVVGECRGGEALDMLQAMNTGHDGSLTTLHANSPKDALGRLETMALMAGLELPSRAIRDQIASAVNIVVQQSRLQDGSRRVTHISEVTGQTDSQFAIADIFVFKQSGVLPDGRITGQYVPTGHVPPFIEHLSRRGLKVPREIFLHQTA
jgi:septum site-determining protein MinD